MKKHLRLVSIVLLCAISAAHAEPTSDDVQIIWVRPYSSATPAAFIGAASPIICSTSAFKIDLSAPGGKEIYAAALTAMTAGKKVKLEISNAKGCQGWGTELQSVTVVAW
jgi:hypothetical protein